MRLFRCTIALVAGGLLGVGIAAEVMVLPRVVPAQDVPMRLQGARAWPDEALVGSLLQRLGPSLPRETRDTLAATLVSEGRRNGYDPLFLLALIGVESNYRLGASSDRGARGLLQLKPSTFAWMAAREPEVAALALESGDDPATDVRLAVRYFHYLEHRFASRAVALMAYNAGPKRVAVARRDGDLSDKYQAYPRKVRREYERIVRLSEGQRLRLDESMVLLARTP